MMNSFLITALNWIICDSLLFILFVILLWNECKIFRSDKHKQIPKSIKISVILWTVFTILIQPCFVLQSIMAFLMSSSLNADYMASIYVLTGILGLLFEVGEWIAIGYFVKLKLEIIFKDKFFAINKTCNSILFIIFVAFVAINYLLVIMNYYLTFYIPTLLTNIIKIPENFINLAFVGWVFSGFVYFIVIIVLFNIKLYKFILLTTNNNQQLSLELNNKLRYAIIKQTNLISLVCFGNLLRYVYYILLTQNNPHLGYAGIWTTFASQFVLLVCVPLSFNYHIDNYISYCNYCHSFWTCTCTKLINKYNKTTNVNVENTNLLNIIPTDMQNNIVEIPLEIHRDMCEYMSKCHNIKFICKFLNEYGTMDKYDYDIKQVMDSFNHLLMFHDSEHSFQIIYKQLQLNGNNNNCHYKTCNIYSRHHNRTRNSRYNQTETTDKIGNNDEKEQLVQIEQKQLEANENILVFMFEKIHSFYYHSYDTLLRNNPLERRNCVEISNKRH
eukprot:8341_1